MAKRIWGALLALTAAGLLVTTALTKTYWQVDHGKSHMGIGPLGLEMCDDGKCKSADLPSKDNFATLGVITLSASLAGAALALLAALIAFAKKNGRVVGILGLIACAAALGAAGTWVGMAPGKSNDALAWGFYASLSGGLLGLIGCALIAGSGRTAMSFATGPLTAGAGAKTLMLKDTAATSGPEARTIAPGMSSPAAPAASPPKMSGKSPAMVPPCPRCHGPLQYAAQFKSWFCPRCQSYVQI